MMLAFDFPDNQYLYYLCMVSGDFFVDSVYTDPFSVAYTDPLNEPYTT